LRTFNFTAYQGMSSNVNITLRLCTHITTKQLCAGTDLLCAVLRLGTDCTDLRVHSGNLTQPKDDTGRLPVTQTQENVHTSRWLQFTPSKTEFYPKDINKFSVYLKRPFLLRLLTPWPSVRERTIPTDDRHLSTKFSANFCG
jgi:hypothetical protein